MPLSMGNTVIATRARINDKGYWLIRDGKLFSIGADEGKLITYISPECEAFRTPEGIRVSDPLEKVFSVAEGKVKELKHWGCYAKLPSGWCVRLGAKKVNKDGTIHQTVLSVFKSKYAN